MDKKENLQNFLEEIKGVLKNSIDIDLQKLQLQ
jgi:hypothetical protein